MTLNIESESDKKQNTVEISDTLHIVVQIKSLTDCLLGDFIPKKVHNIKMVHLKYLLLMWIGFT